MRTGAVFTLVGWLRQMSAAPAINTSATTMTMIRRLCTASNTPGQSDWWVPRRRIAFTPAHRIDGSTPVGRHDPVEDAAIREEGLLRLLPAAEVLVDGKQLELRELHP